MAKYTIDLPVLHEKQEEIYNSDAKYKVVCCGRRFGKTLLATRIATERVLRGESVAVILPTYKMSTALWRKVNADLGVFRSHKNYWKSEQNRILVLPTGGSFSFFSSDGSGDQVRGSHFDYAIIDEAAMIPELRTLWNEALSPTLADKNGDALFISTPRGSGDFFHELYKMGHSKDHEKYQSFHYTTYDNPYIDPDVINEFKKMVPARVFDQEYLAKFMEDSSGVFRGVAKIATLDIREPYSGAFIIGVDFGRKNDYTVAVCIDIKTHEMVDYLRMTGIAFKEQLKRLADFYQKWFAQKMICEANSFGMANIETLRDEHSIPVEAFHTTNSTKKEIIELLAKDIEQENIKLLNDRQLVSELQAYQLNILPSGNIKFDAPSGMHDDWVMATAIANHGVKKSTGVMGVALPKLAGWS